MMSFKKLFAGRKVLVSIIAGAAVTAGAIGAGTYAWFTSSAETGSGDFVTAIVEIVKDESEFYGVFNFFPGHDYTRTANIELEMQMQQSDELGRDKFFLDWWEKYYTENGWGIIPEEDVGVRDPQEIIDENVDRTIFINMADNERVSPGSIVYATYSFTNNSNIPTYFRVPVASLEMAQAGDTYSGGGGGRDRGRDREKQRETDKVLIQAAFITYSGQEEEGYLLTKYDGYYYCSQVLMPGDNVDLIIEAYVLGEANADDVQNKAFIFGDTGVELIQATNNAVYLHTDWKGITEFTDFEFEPYSDVR